MAREKHLNTLQPEMISLASLRRWFWWDSKARAKTMTLNHMHLRIRDLNAAVGWFEKVLRVHPGFRNERMATFSFNSMTLIFDAASDDVSATVGFETDNCDRDFKIVVERGAAVLEPPTDKAWGVRTAYFKGPGELKFEIEGPIAKPLH